MSEKLRVAAQQALECLKGVARGNYDGNASGVCATLEAALEEPDPCQYPGCVDNGPDGKCTRWLLAECERSEDFLRSAQPVQEAVAVYQWRKQGCADWYDGHPDYSDCGGPYETRTLYTAPPQRPLLTDEEISVLFSEAVKGDKSVHWLCRAIERKVRGKKE